MSYLVNNLGYVGQLFLQHLQLTLVVVGISVMIAVPLGVLAVRVKALQGPILSILGVIYTIPSLSLFVLLIPLFGLGFTPAVVAWWHMLN